MQRTDQVWETGSIAWEEFSQFCQHVAITPSLISPFELQAFFQDNGGSDLDEAQDALPEGQFSECIIQCIRHHSSDWADASKTLEKICNRACNHDAHSKFA